MNTKDTSRKAQSESEMQIETIAVSESDLMNRNQSKGLMKRYLIKDVVEHSITHGGLPIYACDKISKTVGAKEFYVGSYGEFFSMYNNLPAKDRCFYETILPEQPCHLYIDMESDIVANEDETALGVCDFIELSLSLIHI